MENFFLKSKSWESNIQSINTTILKKSGYYSVLNQIRKIIIVNLFLLLAISANSQSYEVYDSFDEMEHIFNYQNDTTYVINFWATWCKPCVAELPYFEEANQKYKKGPFKMILVSLDFEKKLKTKLDPFLVERKLSPEVVVLLDGKYQNWIDKVDTEWSGAIPITIVYNAEKRLFLEQPFHDFEELDEVLKQFIN